MRKIKFRAKSKKTGEWVYGCYIETDCDAPAIVWGDGEQEEIDPKTLSQYIGFNDVEDNEIYEGHTLKNTIANNDHKVGAFSLNVEYLTQNFHGWNINTVFIEQMGGKIIGDIHSE